MGLLLEAVPHTALILLVLSVFAMNLLANKQIALEAPYMALDCGIAVSWIAFLIMDVVTKHFGPKAATELSVFAILVNLLFCTMFFTVSLIPGSWSAAGDTEISAEIDRALDRTFGGTWYVILGSAVSLAAASFVNNFTNHGVGLLFRRSPDSAAAYICRSYVSTALGQFADNFIFSLTVSRTFFGWSTVQCILCSLTGMAAELLCEALFSVVGFKVVGRWKRQNVGEDYLRHVARGKGKA